jgi:hypothetical protein
MNFLHEPALLLKECRSWIACDLRQSRHRKARKARAKMSFQRQVELNWEEALTAAGTVTLIRPRTVVAWKWVECLRSGMQWVTNKISLAHFRKYLHALYLLNRRNLFAGSHSLIRLEENSRQDENTELPVPAATSITRGIAPVVMPITVVQHLCCSRL